MTIQDHPPCSSFRRAVIKYCLPGARFTSENSIFIVWRTFKSDELPVTGELKVFEMLHVGQIDSSILFDKQERDLILRKLSAPTLFFFFRLRRLHMKYSQ